MSHPDLPQATLRDLESIVRIGPPSNWSAECTIHQIEFSEQKYSIVKHLLCHLYIHLTDGHKFDPRLVGLNGFC